MSKIEHLENQLMEINKKQRMLLEQQKNFSESSDNDFITSELIDLARESFKIMDKINWEKHKDNLKKTYEND
jgi:hypothetical protein